MDLTTVTALPRRHRTLLLLVGALVALLVGAVVLLGVAGRGEGGGDAQDAARGEYAILPAPAADGGSVAERATGAVADLGAESPRSPASPQEPAIVRTGSVSLTSKDLARTRVDVRRVLDARRGEVADQETTAGDDGISSLRITARVPVAEFAATMSALEEVADLVDSSTTSEDVTTQVLDTEARVRAQRASVDRIEALLARATTIDQIVAIEGQLATRQADLDSLVAQQKWLTEQSQRSTITVTVQEPAPREKDRDGFAGGIASGWDAFVDGSRALLTAVGFALPWLALVALVSVPVWTLRRRRRTPAAAAA